MREYIAIVRAILAGDPPPRGDRWTSNFSFVGLAPRPDIPIYQAALSPAMLRLAGEIADGVMLWACPSDYVRNVVVPEVTAGRAPAGKPLQGFEILAAVPSSVSENRDAAIAASARKTAPLLRPAFLPCDVRGGRLRRRRSGLRRSCA
jgi:alkanesulfonate monooxygenase SsuD/methylene tetrahydromethanopterin reductase-like flavin-dependent oxidoreductase (luciferase family)